MFSIFGHKKADGNNKSSAIVDTIADNSKLNKPQNIQEFPEHSSQGLRAMICPSCGGHLILRSNNMRVCSSCGTSFELPASEKKLNDDALKELVIGNYPDNKMLAIKVYKDKTGCSLFEAKAYVEMIFSQIESGRIIR